MLKYGNLINIESYLDKMKKSSSKSTVFVSAFFISFLSMFFLISCKNSPNSKLEYVENNTLKELIKNREHDVTWTKEIEGERLSKNISTDKEKIASDVAYAREILKIINNNASDSVYPEYEDFGSLDTRQFKTPLKQKVDEFCKALSKNIYSGPESFFNNKYIFNYVFFVKEIEQNWESNFQKSFPIEKSAEKKEVEKNKNETLFSKWILGEPFNGDDITIVPVRFYCSQGVVDVTLYFDNQNSICQITIDRWKKDEHDKK